MSTPPADGRRLRSERSRQAVIDALLDLYDAGTIRPSVAEIAAASGVSERSVFRYFTDLEDLASAAITRQLSQVMDFFADPEPADTTQGRIESLVDKRLALHDRVGNLARAAAYHAVVSPTIAQAVADRRALLRAQVERQLRAELAELRPAPRAQVIAAVDQLLSLEALDFHRTQPTPLAAPALRQLLVDTVAAVLAVALEEAR